MKKVLLPFLIPIAFMILPLIDEQIGTNLDQYLSPVFQVIMGVMFAYYLSILNNGKKHYWVLAALFILMGILNAMMNTAVQNVVVYTFWACMVLFIIIYINRFLAKHPKRIIDMLKLLTISLFVVSYTSNPYFALPAFVHPLSLFLMIGIFFYDYFISHIETRSISYRRSFLFWIILFGGFFMGVLIIATYLISRNM